MAPSKRSTEDRRLRWSMDGLLPSRFRPTNRRQTEETQPTDWFESVVRPYVKSGPSTRNPGQFVSFVGLETSGTRLDGKVTASLFFPIFEYTLRRHGNRMQLFESLHAFLEEAPFDCPNTAVLLYREAKYDIAKVAEAEKQIEATSPGTVIVHGSEMGGIIGSKRQSHDFLTAAGVPMPRLVIDQSSNSYVFSNEDRSTGSKVHVLDPGAPLSRSRYNTEFIDSSHRFDGADYYVYIRAFAVGSTCTTIYVGFRPVSDEEQSVHLKDMPLNPGLVNHVSHSIVARYGRQVHELCTLLGNNLGLGFYSHDFVPSRRTGDVYLSETGFKLDAGEIIRRHLWPIRDQLQLHAPMFTAEEVLRTSYAFASYLQPSADSRDAPLSSRK